MKAYSKLYLLLFISFISLIGSAQTGDSIDTLSCKHEIKKSEKLQGVSINLRLPCDWQFTETPNSKVLATIIGIAEQARTIIGTVDFDPSDIVFTDKEIDYFLSDEALRSVTSHSGTYISSRRIKINGYPSGEVLVMAQNQVNGVTVYFYKIYTYIYFKLGMVMLNFSILSEKENKAKTEFFKRIEILRSIASNILITW